MNITAQVQAFLARLRSGVEEHEQYRETNYAHGYLDALRMMELYVTQLTAVEELAEASASAAKIGKEILANINHLRELAEQVARDKIPRSPNVMYSVSTATRNTTGI